MSKQPSQLVRDIADRIEATLDSYHDGKLPSRAHLARRFGVSHATVSAAAKLLASKGRIELYPGRRMRRTGSDRPGERTTARRTSVTRLSDKLKTWISDGDLPAGQYLPKLDYYVLEEHVTKRTVREAYAKLVAEGLAYRAVKHWIVGSPPRRRNRGARVEPPFLLIVQRQGTSWSRLYSPRTEAFARTFSAEAARFGVRLVSAYTTIEGAPTRLHLAGRENIRRHVAKGKDRYMGALLVDTAGDIPDMGSWVDLLCGSGKPVVWFDALDQPVRFRHGPPLFTRCHFAEARGVAAALDHLAASGHRTVAYVNIDGARWRTGRCELIRTDAARRTPPIDIIMVPAEQFLWADRDVPALAAILAKLRRDPGLARAGVFDSLLDSIPDCTRLLSKAERALLPRGPLSKAVACARAAGQGLHKVSFKSWNYLGALYLCYTAKALLDKGASVIIAPCDRDARSFHTWLSMTDIEIPKRLSLVSFDNYQSLHPLLPISTVDFGFGRLGYAAFHFIFGDVPVPRDRDGDIGARPFVIDRGSVDVPRKPR